MKLRNLIPSTTRGLCAAVIIQCAVLAGTARATILSYTGAIQTYTVTTTGIYDLTVAGAQGGSGTSGAIGGLGAVLEGQVFLNAGLTLQVVVAGQGVDGSSNPVRIGGGGGGGSFVFVLGDTQPLIVAGGGGGGAFLGQSGSAAQTGVNGSAGQGGGTGGAAGTTGSGGSGGAFAANNGGGGAGWLGNGTAGSGGNSGSGGSGPGTFAGGTGETGHGMPFPNGGFGGGGGGGFDGGGGGGGYSGGGGGSGIATSGGGGGGSYFAPAFTLPTSVVTQTGNGSVSINLVSAGPASVPDTGSTFALLGGAMVGLIAVQRRTAGGQKA